MTATIWDTDTIEISTPRGARFQGISYPRGRRSDIRYRSPLRIRANEAWELARSRTIHHNVWHDGTEAAAQIASMHRASDCHERS